MRFPRLLQQGVLVALLAILTGGCAVPIILAIGAGAVGGYSVSRDTFEGVTSKGQDEIWTAAEKVLSIMGTIDENDRKKGEMHSVVDSVQVTLNVIPVNLTTTKLRIKARKGIFPRVGTAQEIYSKIINQLDGNH